MASKKELLNEYKQQKFRIGVFALRNTVNGKVFVGSGQNLDALWNRNRVELNFGNHRNESLQREWKEFGADKFEFEVLSEIKQEDGATTDYNYEVKKLEKMFLEELQPWGERGYHNEPK
ncbi:MAG: GIY-YIG nuclease family protein [Chitinophagaceae bacterium]|nr:MAG: GIY-YIG nuclease family protein [Chitinophagaceae bacterium]